MTKPHLDALHDLRTANHDVLKGLREMAARAEPEIAPDVSKLVSMHEQHDAELERELARLHDASADDSSLQGTLNKAVVIARDWFSDLDRDALPAVRKGEVALRDDYLDALQGDKLPPQATTLVNQQLQALDRAIAQLPQR